jgi:transposase
MPQLAARSNRADADTLTYPDAYHTRNRVERFFAKLKQFRRVATRYDKLKITFRGYLHLVGGWIRFRQNVNAA